MEAAFSPTACAAHVLPRICEELVAQWREALVGQCEQLDRRE